MGNGGESTTNDEIENILRISAGEKL